jgi:hypothetical protein
LLTGDGKSGEVTAVMFIDGVLPVVSGEYEVADEERHGERESDP